MHGPTTCQSQMLPGSDAPFVIASTGVATAKLNKAIHTIAITQMPVPTWRPPLDKEACGSPNGEVSALGALHLGPPSVGGVGIGEGPNREAPGPAGCCGKAHGCDG